MAEDGDAQSMTEIIESWRYYQKHVGNATYQKEIIISEN
jgi:hypothetical protein